MSHFLFNRERFFVKVAGKEKVIIHSCLKRAIGKTRTGSAGVRNHCRSCRRRASKRKEAVRWSSCRERGLAWVKRRTTISDLLGEQLCQRTLLGKRMRKSASFLKASIPHEAGVKKGTKEGKPTFKTRLLFVAPIVTRIEPCQSFGRNTHTKGECNQPISNRLEKWPILMPASCIDVKWTRQ